MRPSLGRSSPATRLRIVLLPQPEGPTTATNSPGRTQKVIRSIAVSGDTPSGAVKRLVTAMSASTDAVISIGSIQGGIDPGKLGFQNGRGPGAAFARRTLDALALERARHLLEVLLAGAKDPLECIGEGALLRLQRAAQGLMLEAGMNVGHGAHSDLNVASGPHERLGRGLRGPRRNPGPAVSFTIRATI